MKVPLLRRSRDSNGTVALPYATPVFCTVYQLRRNGQQGLERVGYNDHIRQGWWCVPVAP